MHGSSQRHSVEDRSPSSDKHKASHRPAHGHPISQSHPSNKQPLTGDKAEHLAERIVQVGADVLDAKAHQRYSDDVIDASTGAYPQSHSIISAEALGNKIMKEAMKEMEREEAHVTGGIIFPGSEASSVQRVVAHKDDPAAKEDGREVAEMVRHRIAHEMAGEEVFVGPNPDAGHGGLAKNRRMRDRGDVLSSGLKTDKNPDVLE